MNSVNFGIARVDSDVCFVRSNPSFSRRNSFVIEHVTNEFECHEDEISFCGDDGEFVMINGEIVAKLMEFQ